MNYQDKKKNAEIGVRDALKWLKSVKTGFNSIQNGLDRATSDPENLPAVYVGIGTAASGMDIAGKPLKELEAALSVTADIIGVYYD